MLLSNDSLKAQPIGIYDSGVGGLAIAKVIKETCPKESIHYIGDTKHLPYGSKTATQLKKYLTSVVHFCLNNQYKVLVIACNTVSCIAKYFLPQYLQNTGLNIPVINVIDPVIAHIMSTGPYKHIGLIGTKQTIQSGIYTARLPTDISKLSLLATPMLAPMVEDSFCGEIDQNIVEMYLKQLDCSSMDLFIPACTHYIFLESNIKHFFFKQYQKTIPMIDFSTLTTQTVQNFLKTHNLENNTGHIVPDCFMTTKLTPAFQNAIQKLFAQNPILINI